MRLSQRSSRRLKSKRVSNSPISILLMLWENSALSFVFYHVADVTLVSAADMYRLPQNAFWDRRRYLDEATLLSPCVCLHWYKLHKSVTSFSGHPVSKCPGTDIQWQFRTVRNQEFNLNREQGIPCRHSEQLNCSDISHHPHTMQAYCGNGGEAPLVLHSASGLTALPWGPALPVWMECEGPRGRLSRSRVDNRNISCPRR